MSKKARAGAGAPETNSSKISRRAFLAAGAGASVLVAVPDLFLTGAAHAQSTVPAAPSARFFLYGTAGPSAPAAIHRWQSPAKAGLAPPKPATVATGIAALPVKSQDGSAVAVPTVDMTTTGAAVTVSIISSDAADTQSSATLTLPGVPSDALVLVRPVFAGSSTVALVMAVSVPSQGGMFTKTSASGEPMSVRAVSWTTNHHLAYLDRKTLTFTGPFDLASAPSLAWTDTAADAQHLYMWTMKEPAAGTGKTSTLPFSPPRLVAYRLGTGEPSLSIRSPGAWPAGQNGHVLQTNDIVRLVDGRDLEVFTPASGKLARVSLAPLDIQTAKPGVTNIHHRPDGTLVVANAAMGRAFVVDPASSFAASGVVDFPRPAIPLGGSDAKTALSPDGTVLFTLGAADTGGLSAIDLASGALVASFSMGAHYSSVHQLPGGSLVAVNPGEGKSQLDFFTSSLAPLATSTTTMYVAEVF